MIVDRLVVGANGCGGYPKRVTHIALNHLTKHRRVREKYTNFRKESLLFLGP